MKTYLAINLNDVYNNSKDGQTIAQIRFMKATNMKKTKTLISTNFPANDWSLVPEGYFNRHIVLKQPAAEPPSLTGQ